jgi:hypothetical protein
VPEFEMLPAENIDRAEMPADRPSAKWSVESNLDRQSTCQF